MSWQVLSVIQTSFDWQFTEPISESVQYVRVKHTFSLPQPTSAYFKGIICQANYGTIPELLNIQKIWGVPGVYHTFLFLPPSNFSDRRIGIRQTGRFRTATLWTAQIEVDPTATFPLSVDFV